MTYEMFDRSDHPSARGARPSPHKLVSICKTGHLRLNRTLRETMEYMEMEYVYLGVDRQRHRLAIKKAAEDDNAYKLSPSKETTGARQIQCIRFLRFYNIDYSSTRSYRVTWNNDLGLFEVQLTPDVFSVPIIGPTT